MLSHTLPLAGREVRHFALTPDEACAMYEKGFRFSIFRPGREECRLSIPYQVVEDRDRGSLTFMQPDGAD